MHGTVTPHIIGCHGDAAAAVTAAKATYNLHHAAMFQSESVPGSLCRPSQAALDYLLPSKRLSTDRLVRAALLG